MMVVRGLPFTISNIEATLSALLNFPAAKPFNLRLSYTNRAGRRLGRQALGMTSARQHSEKPFQSLLVLAQLDCGYNEIILG